MNKVIIDCDPGHDDMLAILLAAKHLDVMAITTVSGNQSLEKVTRNALRILEFSGLGFIPVVPGLDRPWIEPVHHAVTHGESGLDGVSLPEPAIQVHPGHAVDVIIDAAMSGNAFTLIALGPLTNVAAALLREPRLSRRLSQIVMMGGSLTFGNSTPVAEFNIWCDPEAAHVVLSSGVSIKMVGLNLTHQAVAGPAEMERMRALENRTGQIAYRLFDFHCRQYQKLLGMTGAPLHDPCAVAWLIDPTLIESRLLHVAVELRGEYTRGATVCDYRHLPGPDEARQGHAPTVDVALRLDAPRFFDLLLETLAMYP